MNVYDEAHNLARALKNSPEYQSYKAIKEEVSKDAELSAVINDFQEKNMQMQTQQMLTGQIPEGMGETIQSLYQSLAGNPLALQYLQIEMAFTKLVSDVYGILGEVIRVGQ